MVFKVYYLSIPNPQFNWGGLGNESLYLFSLCLCVSVANDLHMKHTCQQAITKDHENYL